MTTQSISFGSWRFQFFGEDPVCVSPLQVAALEAYINQTWLPAAYAAYSRRYGCAASYSMQHGIPSLIVRADIPPASHDGSITPPCEVDCSPAGIGTVVELARLSGQNSRLTLIDRIAETLSSMDISKIAVAVSTSREGQRFDLELTKQALVAAGIHVLNDISDESAMLLMRIGTEDPELLDNKEITRRLLMLHFDNGGCKLAWLPQDGSLGARLTQVADPFKQYPDGFALKPTNSWGARQVAVHTPLTPWKSHGRTRTKMLRLMDAVTAAGFADKAMVQPFYPPGVQKDENNKTRFRIWRMYFIWNRRTGYYEATGGVAMDRLGDLVVHGNAESDVRLLLVG